MIDSRSLLNEAVTRLTGASSTPRLDAEVLLSHCLQTDRLQLLAQPSTELTDDIASAFTDLIERRYHGEPIAYLVGHKEFWGRSFIVTKDVLVPRPDSEVIVEQALAYLKDKPPARVIEIGTGSGIIGLTIAAELPDTQITLTEISPTALEVSRQNAARLGLTDRVEFKMQDLLTNEIGTYDLLVANLPYVPAFWLTQSAQSPETRSLPFEPMIALTDGTDEGLSLMRRFIDQLAAWSGRPAAIFLEHGDGQGEAIAQIASTALPDYSITHAKDLAGTDRVISLLK